MWSVLTAIVVLGFMIGIPILYDILVANVGGLTISEYFKDLGQTYSPLFIYGVSILPGHFWMNFEQSLVNRAGGGELAELFIVLIIGWSVHWAFRANSEWLPLGPWEAFVLIVASVLVGAFLWTQHPVA